MLVDRWAENEHSLLQNSRKSNQQSHCSSSCMLDDQILVRMCFEADGHMAMELLFIEAIDGI